MGRVGRLKESSARQSVEGNPQPILHGNSLHSGEEGRGSRMNIPCDDDLPNRGKINVGGCATVPTRMDAQRGRDRQKRKKGRRLLMTSTFRSFGKPKPWDWWNRNTDHRANAKSPPYGWPNLSGTERCAQARKQTILYLSETQLFGIR